MERTVPAYFLRCTATLLVSWYLSVFAFAVDCPDNLRPKNDSSQVVFVSPKGGERSFASKVKNSAKRIDELDRKLDEKMASYNAKKSKTAGEAVATFSFIHSMLLNELRAMKVELDDPLWRKLLDSSIGNIEKSATDLRRLIQRLEAKEVKLDETWFRMADHALTGSTAQYRGELGELSFAILTDGFTDKGLTYTKLAGALPHERAQKVLEALRTEKMAGELDIISKDAGGTVVWTEVKNFGSPVNEDKTSILEQLRKFKRFRDLVDPKIRLQVHFKGGVTKGMIQKIELLGIKVV